MSAKSRCCVVGAGAAGLCALKYAREYGMDTVAYEKCNEIGGTWVYTEQGVNECAAAAEEVHSSMYAGLRTNLPKEVMDFPDFKYPATMRESYILASDVLKYFQAYAQHFNLLPHIRLQQEVIRVRPLHGQWEVLTLDLNSGIYAKEQFDYIFICNGRYATPCYPKTAGIELYKGHKMHSHVFRKADTFKDATVLMVGAGRSGMDITHHIYPYAKRVYLSHHLQEKPPITDFMPNVVQKPVVVRYTENGAIFKDGTQANFAHIIFCTGYSLTIPFLSADCNLHVHDNFVYPLYKHCININHPTMCFIGLPIYAYPIQLFDMQMRFVMQYYSRKLQLPSAEDMLVDTEHDLEERRARGLPRRKAHVVGERQFDYYDELAALTGIDNVRPVIKKLSKSCGGKFLYDLQNYRKTAFKVIDDHSFVQFKLGEV
ncbi:senecionine N-oxygenase-like [Rhagoletis pomonella]|uniref:senecionine N-oxygenase-like n=1 Tax=Rhagoletis pomonella TaxID=28610 RepID=UPI001785568F|nr:senecionine N-oxygenase-like [Rhagoletis pomonella]XP_036333060.1 senecionine N-oxygenase-like [Rhagoletis pomonella]